MSITDSENPYPPAPPRPDPFGGRLARLPVASIHSVVPLPEPAALPGGFLESVRRNGVMEPLAVAVVPAQDGRRLVVCLDGHRRLAAARHASLAEVSVVEHPLPGSALNGDGGLHPVDFAASVKALHALGMSLGRLELLLERDRRTLTRFLKIASWPDSVKERVRARPELFNARYLLALASRRLDPDELQRIVAEREGGGGTTQTRRRQGRRLALLVEQFCAERGFGERERRIVTEALSYLEILPAERGEGGARPDQAPKDP